MSRDELIDQILNASSVDEVRAAQAAASQWIKEYPDDELVGQALEQLSILASALENPGR